jgi:hypothetical protein
MYVCELVTITAEHPIKTIIKTDRPLTPAGMVGTQQAVRVWQPLL